MNSNQLRGWLVIFLILAALLSFTSRNYAPQHSIYNDGEYGTSRLYDRLRENQIGLDISRLLISPFGLQELREIDFMVIIGSERAYTSSEISSYRNFVAEGGTLLIFEDFGYAKDIAETMGISYFDGTIRERNDQLYVNRPSQFIVQDYLPAFFGYGEPGFLLVNEGSGIMDLSGIRERTTIPFLLSTPSAYIDTDDDQNVDENDLQIPEGIPMGLFKQYEEGYLMVISDASIPLNIHHQRTIELQNNLLEVPNIRWSNLVIQTIASFTNSTSVVFDESHQEIVLSSSAGLLNLIASTWVGIFNSGDLIAGLFVIIIIFAFLLNRDIYGIVIKQFRANRNGNGVTTREFVSNPTLAERGLSEQYILYKRMGNEFIQIANLELYNQIKEFGKSNEFLAEFDKKYGDIKSRRSAQELFQMHYEMRNHLNNELMKWL